MIPKEIYTLGAVRFNTQPLAQLQGQLLAKREAKRAAEDDAINKYLTDQAGKLTPTGVRAIDLPGFEKRRKDWMQFSILNKDKIKKDPLTRMEADRLYNDALAWQQQSKDATGERTPAIDLIRNPNTRNQLNFERVAADITLHDLSLDDPNRKKIDYNASWYKAPSFDFNKEFKVAAEGQQKAFLRKIPGTLDTQLGTIQTEEGFLPESIKQIARNFARSVIEDPNKLDYYERKSKSASADELIKLNAILKPYFPKLEVALDQPEALAMAEAIERAQSIKDVVPREDKAYSSRLISSRQQGFGYGYPFGVGIEGNALDEITNVVGVKKGVVVKDGVANINGVPYSGKIVMLGNEIPESVRSPLKSIGYKFSDAEQVDVNMVDGKIESIQALGRTSSGVPAKRKSVVSRSMMENAQLKFNTEPQKGPQMQFGQGLSPKTPAFTFPGGKPIKF